MGRLIQVGNGSEHELVKERDGECHVAMRRTVDHTFLDEFGANRAKAVDRNPQGVGDVSGALGTGPETGHGPQKPLLPRREAVEADAEEVLIQALNDRGTGVVDDVQGDGRCLGAIPALVAPFLEEIGIALGQAEDFF